MLTKDDKVISTNMKNIKNIFNIKSLLNSHIRFQNRFISSAEIASRGNNINKYKDILS